MLMFLRKPIAYSAVILDKCHVSEEKLTKDIEAGKKEGRKEGRKKGRKEEKEKGRRKERREEIGSLCSNRSSMILKDSL